MVNSQKIIAVFGEIDFNHEFFKKSTPEDIKTIKENIQSGISVPITFLDEKMNVLFFSVYDVNDVYKDGVHVHLLTGNFLRFYKFLTAFYEGLALHLGKVRVTYCTKRRAVRDLGLKVGYEFNIFGDLEKRVA